VSKGILIQPRDLAIMQSLSDARFLTVETLEWLHFPQWRARYRAWRQQREAGAAARARYYATTCAYVRLRALRLAGMLGSIGRAVDTANTVITSLDTSYFLTERGAGELAARTDQALNDLWWEEGGRRRSVQNLEHSVEIGRVYAALRCALARDGQQLTAWQGDHRLNAPQQYDRLLIAGQREPVPLAPDATFLLDGRRYFVEVDRGTRPLRSWSEKAQAYRQYRQHALLRARYGCDNFLLLIVAPSAQRLQRIAETIAQAARGPDLSVLLLDAAHLHPNRIRANWETVADARPVRRNALGGTVTVYEPQLASAVLWDAPPAGVANGGAKQGAKRG
jgi:hypothetical protein